MVGLRALVSSRQWVRGKESLEGRVAAGQRASKLLLCIITEAEAGIIGIAAGNRCARAVGPGVGNMGCVSAARTDAGGTPEARCVSMVVCGKSQSLTAERS